MAEKLLGVGFLVVLALGLAVVSTGADSWVIVGVFVGLVLVMALTRPK